MSTDLGITALARQRMNREEYEALKEWLREHRGVTLNALWYRAREGRYEAILSQGQRRVVTTASRPFPAFVAATSEWEHPTIVSVIGGAA